MAEEFKVGDKVKLSEDVTKFSGNNQQHAGKRGAIVKSGGVQIGDSESSLSEEKSVNAWLIALDEGGIVMQPETNLEKM